MLNTFVVIFNYLANQRVRKKRDAVFCLFIETTIYSHYHSILSEDGASIEEVSSIQDQELLKAQSTATVERDASANSANKKTSDIRSNNNNISKAVSKPVKVRVRLMFL